MATPRQRTVWRVGLLTLVGWPLIPGLARACAVCLGWTDGQGPNWGYYWSWLLLSLLPFVLVGVIGAWLAVAFRRRDAVGTAPEPGEPRSERETVQPRGVSAFRGPL